MSTISLAFVSFLYLECASKLLMMLCHNCNCYSVVTISRIVFVARILSFSFASSSLVLIPSFPLPHTHIPIYTHNAACWPLLPPNRHGSVSFGIRITNSHIELEQRNSKTSPDTKYHSHSPPTAAWTILAEGWPSQPKQKRSKLKVSAFAWLHLSWRCSCSANDMPSHHIHRHFFLFVLLVSSGSSKAMSGAVGVLPKQAANVYAEQECNCRVLFLAASEYLWCSWLLVVQQPNRSPANFFNSIRSFSADLFHISIKWTSDSRNVLFVLQRATCMPWPWLQWIQLKFKFRLFCSSVVAAHKYE